MNLVKAAFRSPQVVLDVQALVSPSAVLPSRCVIEPLYDLEHVSGSGRYASYDTHRSTEYAQSGV